MFSALARIGIAADEPEQQRYGGAQGVARSVEMIVPARRATLERRQEMNGLAGISSRREDSNVAAVQKVRELRLGNRPLRELRLSPFGGRRDQWKIGNAIFVSASGFHPRLHFFRIKAGKRQFEVRQITFDVDQKDRDPSAERLLDQNDEQPGLAGPGHARDDAVGEEVVHRQLERAAIGAVDGSAYPQLERRAHCWVSAVGGQEWRENSGSCLNRPAEPPERQPEEG